MFGRAGGGGRKVCQFFLEGRCKFGDNCKNEHPRNQASTNGSANNRFAPLQNQNNAPRIRANEQGQDPRNEPFGLTTSAIQRDLTTGGADGERPTWPLSCYAPGVNAPRQLIDGDMEYSAEEMRVLCYLAQANGNPQEYVQKEQAMVAQMDEKVQKILGDLIGAKKYIIAGQNIHPNRNDMVIKPNRPFPPATLTPAATTGAFGQQNTLGAGAANNTSAFGQPSNLGGAVRPAFGAPSAMGAAPSAFGQPSNLGGNSGFGKTSALGGTSAFGQPSNPAQNNAFGAPSQPSAFGQPSNLGGSSPFAAATQQQQQQQPAFGQASQPSGFGQASATPAFGQPTKPSGFGQVSATPAFGQPSVPSAFGQQPASATAQPSPFAANQPASGNNAFGQPSAFGAKSANSSPFSVDSPTPTSLKQSQPPANPFGQPRSATSNPFSAASSAPSPLTNTSNPTPTSGASPWQNKRTVQDDNGQPCYIDSVPGQPDRLVRIWFPSGAPAPSATNALVEGSPEAYEGEAGAALKAIYDRVRETGSFGDSVMPETPPKREWVSFDL